MSVKESKLLTTKQAYERLGMSRATFFNRVKDHPDIKPVNHNPNLKRQPNPLWKLEDVNRLGTPIHPDEDDEHHVA